MRSGLFLGELAALDELGQQTRPLPAKLVGAGEAAIAADHNDAVDVVRYQVLGGL